MREKKEHDLIWKIKTRNDQEWHSKKKVKMKMVIIIIIAKKTTTTTKIITKIKYRAAHTNI